jgi:hypothetical protein
LAPSASGSDTGSPRIVVCVLRCDIDENALAQLDPLQIGAIGVERLLGIGPPFGIVEERARNPAARGFSQIFDTGHGSHGRTIPRLFGFR